MSWQLGIDRSDTFTDTVARGAGRIAVQMLLPRPPKQYHTGTDIVEGCALAEMGGDAFIIAPPGSFGPS
jgi:N-methylhydantoinase A/oxoprolinase/acetone carboxylase beta subunit